MSSGRLFLDRGGRHQSPSPLRRHPQNKSMAFRRPSNYHRTAGSVLTVCVSRGDKRSLDQKIAGYPAIRVRDLMRQTAGGPIMFRDVRRILQCSDIAAARVMKHLEKDA